MTDRIVIEENGIDELITGLARTSKRMAKVTRDASNTTMKTAQKAIRASYAEEIGIAQRHTSPRVRFRSAKARAVGRSGFARVWVGLNPFSVTKRIFGRLRQEDAGAWAKDYFFEGSFVARMPSGHTAIWKRIAAINPATGRQKIRHEEVEADLPKIRRNIEKVADNARVVFLTEVSEGIDEDFKKAVR